MKKYLLFTLLFPLLSYGFLPPIAGVLKEIFDSRKAGALIEITYRHQVELAEGALVLEESFISTPRRTYILWKTANANPVFSIQEHRAYLIGDRKLSSKSLLYAKYLSGTSAEDFKEQLISEEFMRREQLLQYKAGFLFEGDPDSWQLQDNYLKHPDIQYKRLDSIVSIAVRGMDDGPNQRTVYFDRKLEGIKRFEWKENNNLSSWNFKDFNKYAEGFFPKIITFEQGGREFVRSELLQVKALKDKAIQNTVKSWQKMGGRNAPTGSMEEALKVLLSFR